jgi:hypothetical protein
MLIPIGRNDPCHCGSGKKYKKCHLEKDELEGRKKREKAALNAAAVASKKGETETAPSSDSKPKPPRQGGWIKKMANKVGFFRDKSLERRITPANKGG